MSIRRKIILRELDRLQAEFLRAYVRGAPKKMKRIQRRMTVLLEGLA